MTANSDKDGQRWKLREVDYSRKFIIQSGEEFNFDGGNSEIAAELNYIRSSYIASRSVDGHDEYRKEV